MSSASMAQSSSSDVFLNFLLGGGMQGIADVEAEETLRAPRVSENGTDFSMNPVSLKFSCDSLEQLYRASEKTARLRRHDAVFHIILPFFHLRTISLLFTGDFLMMLQRIIIHSCIVYVRSALKQLWLLDFLQIILFPALFVCSILFRVARNGVLTIPDAVGILSLLTVYSITVRQWLRTLVVAGAVVCILFFGLLFVHGRNIAMENIAFCINAFGIVTLISFVLERESRLNFVLRRCVTQEKMTWKGVLEACTDGIVVQTEDGVVFSNKAARVLASADQSASPVSSSSSSSSSSFSSSLFDSPSPEHHYVAPRPKPPSKATGGLPAPFLSKFHNESQTILSGLQSSFQDLEISIPETQQATDKLQRLLQLSGSRASWWGQVAAVVVLRDVTQQKLADAQKHGDVAKSTMLAVVSHEFRTPLNGVLGMLQLLQECPQSDEGERYIHHAFTSAKLLQSVVYDILDFSKMEAGALDLSREPVDIRGCIQDVVDEFRLQAADKGLELNFSYPVLPVSSTPPPSPSLSDSFSSSTRHTFSSSSSSSSSSSASFEEAQAAGALDTAVQWPSSELLHSESISESVNDAVLPKSVLSDSRRIQQIIINVLSNAVKYTSKGSVTCSLSILQDREDDMVLEIAIRDTGTGFTKPLRLQSLEQNVKGEGGLGLYICRRLCEVMGGELIIESTPNVGTLVRVSIMVGKIKVNSENSQPLQTVAFPFRQAGLLESPVYDPSTASSDTNSHPRMLQTMQNVLTQRRVLVVEDNDFNAFVVSAMLTKDGFDVSRANNGLQCINMLEDALRVKGDFDFDLILMDYQMPEMDGVMTTQRIREIESKLNRPPIPVVALTALSSSKDRDRLLAAGMDAFLSKPVCRPSLYSTATHLISLYRQSRTTTSSTASSTSASASIFRSTSGTASRITTTVSTRQTVRTVRTVDVQDVSEVNENQPQAGVILTNQDKTEKDISVEEARQ